MELERTRASCTRRWLTAIALIIVAAHSGPAQAGDPDRELIREYAGPLSALVGGDIEQAPTGDRSDDWYPLGSGTSGAVYALAEYQGDLYAGGVFQYVGDQQVNYIARWNGTSWTPVGAGFNSAVMALIVYDWELYAGGYFTRSGSLTRNHVARWDGSSWNNVGGGVGGYEPVVRAFTEHNGKLIVGGQFNTAGTNPPVTANNVARWDGGTWSALGSPPSVLQAVHALASYGGKVFAGFFATGQEGFNYIAQWDGTDWTGVPDGGVGMDSAVAALQVYSGSLYAGGHFWAPGGVSSPLIGRWDGSSWYAVGSGMSNGGQDIVEALTVWNDVLVAGGQFSSAGGVSASNIAAWNGLSWSAFGLGMNGSVYAVCDWGGTLVAGGHFSQAGYNTVNNIAFWSGSTPPENDGRGDAEPAGEETDTPFDTTYATFDGDGLCQTAPNVWYCYAPSASGTATITLCGSSYDTRLAVYDDCGEPMGAMLDCNGDSYCDGEWTSQSTCVVPVVEGAAYLIEVGGDAGATGSGVLSICLDEEGDRHPPDWRGEDRTTAQGWSFRDRDTAHVPDMVDNAYGEPTLDLSGWGRLECFMGRQGVVHRDASGALPFFIPNDPEPGPEKWIWVQITYWDHAPAYWDVVWGDGSWSSQTPPLIERVEHAGGWFTDVVWITIPENPPHEWLEIWFDDPGGYVDGVVIDTQCVVQVDEEYVPWQSLTGVLYSDAQWGDIDDDDDLDLVICGETNDGSLVTEIYGNQGGTLQPHQSLEGIKNTGSGCLAWGDYDGDGDLDLAIAGQAAGGLRLARLYENEGLASGDFSHDADQMLTGVEAACVAWGDYDNDGDLDLFVNGTDGTQEIATLYVNDPLGTLSPHPTLSLRGLRGGSADWADIDNDGDLDLLLTGYDDPNRYAVFYINDPVGVLTEDGGHGLTGVNLSDAAFGDYDNDGDLDLACTGGTAHGGPNTAFICENMGDGTFTEVVEPLEIYRGSCAWGDYDNDGDLDVAFSGHTGSGHHTKIYENTGSGFGEAFSLYGIYEGSVSFADVDNDGDLDFFVTGYDWYVAYAELYEKRGGVQNTAPVAPTALTCDGSNGRLDLSWSGAFDNETVPPEGLYYCLRVGTASQEHDVVSGTYGSPLMGNVDQATDLVLAVPPGTYSWSVRTIDSGLMASAWSAEQVCEVLDECPGDVDGDGNVGFSDLLVILAAWGPCQPTCPEDIDGDGDVGFSDLLIVLAAWGPCP